MSRNVRQSCLPSSSQNKTRNYYYETNQTSSNLMSTHSGYSTHDNMQNQTFNVLSPMEAGMIPPSCCMSQGLPIYNRTIDPTVTTAPRITAAKSDCTCNKNFQRTREEQREMYVPPGRSRDQTYGAGNSPLNLQYRRPLPEYNQNNSTYGGRKMKLEFRPLLPEHWNKNQRPENYQKHPTYGNGGSKTKLQYRPLLPEHWEKNRPWASGSNWKEKTYVYPNRSLGFGSNRMDQTNVYPNRPLGFGSNRMDQTNVYPNRPLGFGSNRMDQTNVYPNRHLGFGSNRIDQTNVYPNRPLGFDHLRSPIGFEEFQQTSETYPDLGPWRNFNLPKNIRIAHVPSKANKTYPRTSVPPPSRYYSTYDDRQPIVNVREVAMHRKRAPRFHSTPTDADFANEGTNISSVWGQDLDSMRQTPTSSFVDSSLGWSQGVRMDSFNVLTEMTPSPKNVKVPPRLNTSYMPATTTKRVDPGFQKTHTYIQNPYAHLEYLSKLPLGVDPVAERAGRRVLQRTAVTGDSARKGASSRGKQGSPAVPNKQKETYCAPCGNTTFSVERTGNPSEEETINKTMTISKKSDKSEEDKSQAAKDFCTVLEIRTPCGNNANKSDKPLQLSINVTCADPSLLVTPDKRYNVISNSSVPEAAETSNQLEDVPSDCECG